MPTPTAPDADRPRGLQWDFTSGGFANGAIALSLFAALYSLLVLPWGLFLHENVEKLTIMWPAAGLLFMALWLAPRRRWIWILGIQVTIELLAGAVKSDHFSFREYLPFVLANSLDAMAGAWVASRLIPTPRTPRMRNVLLFIASVAVGAAASAVVGRLTPTTRTLGGPEYLAANGRSGGPVTGWDRCASRRSSWGGRFGCTPGSIQPRRLPRSK